MTRKRENVIVEVRDNIIRRTVQALARKGTSEDLGRVLDVLNTMHLFLFFIVSLRHQYTQLATRKLCRITAVIKQ